MVFQIYRVAILLALLSEDYNSLCTIYLSSTGQGSCWIYDTQFLAEGIFWACFIVKGISSFTFLLALLLYKPPPAEENLKEEIDVVMETDINIKKEYIDLGDMVKNSPDSEKTSTSWSMNIS